MLTNPIQVLKQTELCGRQFTVYGTVEEPLFRAKDVAEVINHNNISHMLSLVDDDGKGVKQILHEVRTTGGYLATRQDDTPEEIMARALTIAQATLAKREERLKQLEAQAEQQQVTIEIQTEEIKKSAPKVSYYDNHLQSVNTQTSTQAAQEAERNRNHIPAKRTVDITCTLFYMGDAFYPYTDMRLSGFFRIVHALKMDFALLRG